MTWIKIDDHFPEDPDAIAIGEDASWLHLVAIAYCSRHLTDGKLPRKMVTKLTGKRSPMKLVQRLLDVGWWIEEGDDFLIPKYLEHQRSRKQVVEEREMSRQRQEKVRKMSRRDISVTSPEVTALVQPLELEVDTELETDTESELESDIEVSPTGTSAIEPRRTRSLSQAESLADHHLATLQPELARGGSFDLLEEFRAVWETAWTEAAATGIPTNQVGQRLLAHFIATVTGMEPNYARAGQLVNRFGKMSLYGIDRAIKNDPTNPYSYAWSVCESKVAEVKA